MGLTLEESASRVGHLCWAEKRLFEVLGAWAPSTSRLDTKLMFDRHSMHHAWRSAQWWDRLPVLSELDRLSLVAPPRGWQAVAEAVAQLDGVTARLAGAYRFALPRLAGAYLRLRRLAAEVSDGPVLRMLDLLEPDVTADWHEGEVLLQEVLVSPAEVDLAARTVNTLDKMLATEGGYDRGTDGIDRTRSSNDKSAAYREAAEP